MIQFINEHLRRDDVPVKKEKLVCPSNYKSFGLALQALVIMTQQAHRCPSGEIAEHLCSEASVIRRIMARLTQAGILEVREGRDGGYRLKRDPQRITCAEVFQVLQVGEANSLLDSTGTHPWGLCMQDVFSDLSSEIEQSVNAVLEKYTIDQLAQRLHSSDPS